MHTDQDHERKEDEDTEGKKEILLLSENLDTGNYLSRTRNLRQVFHGRVLLTDHQHYIKIVLCGRFCVFFFFFFYRMLHEHGSAAIHPPVHIHMLTVGE